MTNFNDARKDSCFKTQIKETKSLESERDQSGNPVIHGAVQGSGRDRAGQGRKLLNFNRKLH